MGRKNLDLEKMYQKIMPTYYEEKQGDFDTEVSQITNTHSKIDVDSIENNLDRLVNESLLQNKEIERLRDRDQRVILYNITENIVLTKLEMVLSKMTCCKCDRCKMDIVSIALNNLEPHYVVNTRSAIDKKIEGILTSDYSQQVTSAVLKAALAVRKDPRH